ncbi:DUF2235 domain-containing protein [Jiella mangrovi]|uniref:DUF2235 domain-containing protein n=1 Tax=Jiella mangrovi TaxID=2821407 RepID=A0ABS4BHN7_9HYPH|nr:DUF2235 domain-containing protein [Jiella mangrovi]MBP0616255.1 DUF2235 domain-containing protein [Jiella mangrovi]
MRGQKRLVVCFDGTWNNADTSGDNATNVERIARAVKGDSGDIPQITLYLRGVGSTGYRLQRIIDGATGNGVDDNIRSAYQFLAQNYLPERPDGNGDLIPADEIFLFGFSRGAFSARSLAGFLSTSGLLKRQRLGDIKAAWDYYREEGGDKTSKSFCEASGSDCHHDPEIRFLGVWDTVGSLGIPTSTIDLPLLEKEFAFHDTTPSRLARHAYHAIAIDEHRDEFVPTLWTGDIPAGATIEQVWFAGAHSDVGGGYGNRELADIPLHWMAEKARACGLDLDDSLLPRREDLRPVEAPQHESRVSFGFKDRITPTIRKILGAEFHTAFYETAYPEDPIDSINETIHESARQRFGKNVRVIVGDDGRNSGTMDYEPKNLAAALEKEHGG